MTQTDPSQSELATQGRAVWRDMMTTDVEKSKAFYTAMFGWTINPVDIGEDAPYDMFRAGELDIGGFVPLDPALGVPSHWMAYVTVPDVDAAMASATAQGAVSVMPPTDLPQIGRYGILRDPAGAVLSPFKSAHGERPESEPGPGEFCWEELLTPDPDAAKAFYTSVIGWKTEDMDMGPEVGTYTMLARPDNGQTSGGIMRMPPDVEAPAHWLSYIAVEDVDDAAERAKGLGAAECVAPRDIPGIGRFAVFTDPAGAQFAVYASAPQP